MPLDPADWPGDLDPALPGADDPLQEGDDAIRHLALVMKNAFPNIKGAVTATHANLNFMTGVTAAVRTANSAPLAGEWVLMKSTTIAGAPSAVDFVSGSGGVTISTAYSEFELVFANITQASSNAKLRMDFSNNGGSSFAVGASDGSVHRIDGASSTTAQLTLAYLPVNGDQANASELTGIYASVRLIRDRTNDTFGVITQYHGSTAGRGGSYRGRLSVATGFNAMRAFWDSGAFANTGTIALYGRKG